MPENPIRDCTSIRSMSTSRFNTPYSRPNRKDIKETMKRITSSNGRFLEITWWTKTVKPTSSEGQDNHRGSNNQELSPNYVGTWRSKTTTEHEHHTSVFCNSLHHHLPRDNSGVWDLLSLNELHSRQSSTTAFPGSIEMRCAWSKVLLVRKAWIGLQTRLLCHPIWNRAQRITDIDPDPTLDS